MNIPTPKFTKTQDGLYACDAGQGIWTDGYCYFIEKVNGGWAVFSEEKSADEHEGTFKTFREAKVYAVEDAIHFLECWLEIYNVGFQEALELRAHWEENGRNVQDEWWARERAVQNDRA